MTNPTSSANLPTLYDPIVDTDGLGPHMLELTPQQRAFVLAMLDTGGQDNSKAASLAGYGGDNPGSDRVQAHRLAHSPKVLAAIKEEANKRLHSGAILGASVLIEIARDVCHKDRYKAASELLSRGGLIMATEHKITVERKDDQAMIAKITALATQLGLDPKQLLGQAAPTIDAEFEDVTPTAAGLEDLL